jgi:hypothetical protein
MTDEQKANLRKLNEKKEFNIFDSINFIQQNVYSNNGNFSLKYNAKSNFWILKGRFIGVITKAFETDNLIYASSLPLLQKKLLKQLNLYLEQA